MTLFKTPAKNQKGFTLIELSIVLVIIGLIVGGVLVGQDLIKAAELRATVGQLEKYNAAVNTFRGKFGGIPGDLERTQASAFGLYAFTSGTTGAGDGNGLVEAWGGGANVTRGVGETLLFWRHLSDANLIDGAFGSATNNTPGLSNGQVPSAVTGSNMAQSLPPAKLGRGNYIAVYAPPTGTGTFGVTNTGAGTNFYEINGFSGIATSGAYTATPQMTPVEAYNVDQKVDDGAPNTGGVRATNGTTDLLSLDPTTTATTGCVSAVSATGTYTRTNNSPACGLRARFN